MKRLFVARLTGLAVFGLCGTSIEAIAVPVTILNPSFEDPALADSGVAGDIADWTEITTFGGSYNPGPGYAGGLVSDGNNVAWGNNSAFQLTQTLSATLAADTQYTLTTVLGNRDDVAWPGYEIQFLAGGNVLAFDNSTVTPPEGGFANSVITYLATVASPGLGQNLEIRLRSLGTQANFDVVSLDATSTTTPDPGLPEPSTLVLVGSALLSLAAVRRRYLPLNR